MGQVCKGLWPIHLPPASRAKRLHARRRAPQALVQHLPDEVEKLAKQQADILITHEAPGYHEHRFKELDSLARRMGVPMTVHRHQHDNIDSSAQRDAQGFQSFGVVLQGVMAVDKLA